MKSPIVGAALLCAAPVLAEEPGWSVDVELLQLELSGHDREVLIDRAFDGGGGSSSTTTTRLESESALAYRADLRWDRGRWSYGLAFLSHRTEQDAPRRTGAAGGAVDRRVFFVGGGQVASNDPGERLYFERLEDTTVELWTLDLFAARELTRGAQGAVELLFGLRAADFDNDFHAVVGLEEIGGLRLDASSNYDRMQGPIMGIAGRWERGRNRLEGRLVQSIVWGDVELTSGVREFVGPPSFDVDQVPGVVSGTRFQTTDSVTIPITELQVAWRFRITDHLAAGLGAFYSRWGDVAVPPGVVAGSELSTLDENTIESYGASVGVEVSF